MKIHVVKTQAAQGDLIVRRIRKIPRDAIDLPASLDGHVVAHSETGHHHVAVPVGRAAIRHLRPKTTDGEFALVSFLAVSGGSADIVHRRPWDTHDPLRLPAGSWEIRRQREWRPEGWAPVVD